MQFLKLLTKPAKPRSIICEHFQAFLFAHYNFDKNSLVLRRFLNLCNPKILLTKIFEVAAGCLQNVIITQIQRPNYKNYIKGNFISQTKGFTRFSATSINIILSYYFLLY